MASSPSATALVNSLNRVQFIAEDFATYRSEAQNFFLTNYPQDFNNVLNTDLGNAMVDQLAFAMQALSFMLNRRASELFFKTARLNSSIVKLASMLGYAIAPAAPATTTLNITFPGAPYVNTIPIPSGFQWQGPGTTIYEYVSPSLLSANLLPGQTTLSIPIKEGQTTTATFVSDGTPGQVFSLFGISTGQFLYSDSFLTTVDGIAWTRTPLLKYESSNIYQVFFVSDPPQIEFGDGITGNIPPINNSIVVSYRFGQGLAGAIGSNQITGPVTPLVVAGNTIPMTVTNLAVDVGSDPEDIRHVKIFASAFFRTQNAAVIKSDYDTIAELQPGVALADAEIVRGIDSDVTIQGDFATIAMGQALVDSAVSGILHAGVSGQSFLGVSGTSFLGWNGSSVTGTQFLGVSGESHLGISGISFISGDATSGNFLIDSGVSGLSDYLSQAFSDTSVANQVQVTVLGLDSNNRYISPSLSVLSNVQTTLQGLADAVVTVVAVDGSSFIVNTNILIELGISQTAVQADVESLALQALTQNQNSSPFGLLVRRKAGINLYKSQIQDAIEAAVDNTNTGDIIYMNITIQSPLSMLDAAGNLILTNRHQVIQNGTIQVVTVERVLSANTESGS